MTKQEFMAMSLPYRLKCLRIGSDGFFKSDSSKDDYSYITTLHGIIGYCYYFKEDFNDIEFIEETEFKPILRPISMLNKPCLKGGKTPMIEIFKTLLGESVQNDLVIFSNNSILNYKDNCLNIYDFTKLPFCVASKIIEYHFDIAELIEKGDAIDINNIPSSSCY